MNSQQQKPVQQPLSAMHYVYVSGVLLLVGIALLLAFVWLAPKLIPANLIANFFYIVLLAWALICAVILCGVLISYAHVTSKRFGLKVVLGGPAAIALLVVIGGYIFMPRQDPQDTFDLTVRPHAPETPLITEGKIRIEFGNRSDTQNVRENGEADFKGIPSLYQGKQVKVLPIIKGYSEEYQAILLNGETIDLLLTVKNPIFVGKIFPVPAHPEMVRVLFGSESGEAKIDTYGRFSFPLHKNIGDRIEVSVCENGKRIFDQSMIIGSEEISVPTRRPDAKCGEVLKIDSSSESETRRKISLPQVKPDPPKPQAAPQSALSTPQPASASTPSSETCPAGTPLIDGWDLVYDSRQIYDPRQSPDPHLDYQYHLHSIPDLLQKEMSKSSPLKIDIDGLASNTQHRFGAKEAMSLLADIHKVVEKPIVEIRKNSYGPIPGDYIEEKLTRELSGDGLVWTYVVHKKDEIPIKQGARVKFSSSQITSFDELLKNIDKASIRQVKMWCDKAEEDLTNPQ